MLALPAPAAPSRPRMQLVATALACAGGTMVIGTLLGAYLHFRSEAGGTTPVWKPEGVEIPQVAAATVLGVIWAACVLIQWAVYSIARDDRSHAYQALALTGLFGIAAVNGQAYVWRWLGASVATDDTPYAAVTTTVTAAWVILAVAGIVYLAVMVFRSLGGRYSAKDTEGITALALYWYFLAVSYSAIWYVVYVLK
jgi:heme/copper-type cytochrome/quinol oxidase subunit 3